MGLLLLLLTAVALLSQQRSAAATLVCLMQGWLLLLCMCQLLASCLARLWEGCPSCGSCSWCWPQVGLAK
jgi:hypothetical protein